MQMSKSKIAALVVAVPVLGVVLIAIGAYAYIQTDAGRNFVARQIEAAVDDGQGLSLKIGDIDGDLFSSFTVRDMQLSDANGEWLNAQGLMLSWKPLKLVRGVFEIREFTAQSIDFSRPPELGPASTGGETTGFSGLPIDIFLDRMLVQSIKIGEPVFGREAILRVTLNADARTDGLIHSDLDIVQIGTGAGSVAGSIDFHPVERTLAVDIKLDEPEGGLIARALEIPGYPKISAAIVGNGLLNAWRGQIRASVEKFFDGEVAITTRGEEVIAIGLDGGGQFDEDCVESIPLVDASRIGLDADLTWDIGNGDIALKSSRLENNILALALTGDINLGSQNFKAALTTELRDGAEVNKLIAPAALQSAKVTVDLAGDFKNITANTIVQAGELQLAEGLRAGGMTGTFTSKLDLETLAAIPVTGSAALTDVTGLPDLASGMLGTDLDLDFDVSYLPRTEFLRMDKAIVTGTHASTEIVGGYSLSTGATTISANALATDLNLVLPLQGKMSAKLSLVSDNIATGFSGDITTSITELVMDDADLQGLVGGEATMSSEISLANDSFELQKITLASGPVKAMGEATFPLSFDSLTSAFDVTLGSLAGLSNFAGSNLAGTGRLTGALNGALDDPSLTGNLTLESLKADEMGLGALTADFTADKLVSGPGGSVTGQLVHDGLVADFATAYVMPDYTRLDLTGISMTEKNNSLIGALAIPFDGSPLTGELTGKVPDAGAVARLLDEQATGTLDFTGRLLDRSGQQSLSLDLTGESLTLASAGLSINTLKVTSSTSGALDAPDVVATLIADGIGADELSFKQLTLTGKGSLEKTDFTFNLDGGSEPDLQLEGAGNLVLGKTETELVISALTGEFARRKIALNKAISFRQRGAEIELDEFDITLGDGGISGSASLGNAGSNTNLKITDLPLDLLEMFDPSLDLEGSLEGTAAISVTANGVSSGDVSMRALNVRMAGEEYDGFPALAGRLTANLKDGMFSFTGDVTGLEKTDMRASGSLPIDLTLAPFEAALNQDKPVSIQVDADSDIKALWPLLVLDTHVLTGQLTASGQMNGSFSAPVIDGTAQLKDGSFSNAEFGTTLNKLNFEARIQDTETLHLSGNAVDGKGGSVSAEGVITLASLADPNIDLTIELNKMLVVEQDEIEATSDAKVAIKGPMSALAVTGDITTREVDINIGGALASSVVDLKVEEINKPGAVAGVADEGSDFGRTTTLNLALDLPKRVFIRGRGLDSEWEGRFSIKGTVDSPAIDGYLKPVRGQFTFAGKSFALQSGEISLLGGTDLDPELDLSAKYEATNIIALVSIDGTASDPKISFSSPDGRPEDEVLSQVLFGKSSGRLSALEAVQLAEALASLSGKFGSGGGIMGFMRDTLGVDVISAGTDAETGKAEVSVGKYISDSVYVGVDQGSEAGSTRAKVQIDLTPNISLETEMGQSSDSRVGIFWKWDY